MLPHSRIRATTLRVLAASVATAGLLLLPATSAHAATAQPASTGPCYTSPSQKNCDRQDPIKQGCNADAVTVAGFTVTRPWGKIELRWSNHCKTNWTRFTAAYESTWAVNVERQSPHLQVGEAVEIAAGGQHYTDMVYAPGPAQACANDVNSDNGACTGYTK
ncbi:DUF2690 domain-containing protein [Streptomyces sp. IMTB 2501]|uniref:DUF2690 domain-containing protein n=1 Tax=Streptomyces sp. IMTB 2501 TaxID=1776340 RepID=UPI0015BFF4A9|nr:DUF2690 domain-containing protein [Streptomyces sp. IMTB 2501]